MEVGKYTYGQQHINVKRWPDHTRRENIEETGEIKLTIGSFCSIAENVTVFLAGNHRSEWITTYPFGRVNQNVFNCSDYDCGKSNGDVNIGNDVWIGNGVTIMSGIKVGSGAIIAANSHVVKNVEPYTIVGGNPARPIKKRFSEEQIEKLLQIAWWDWDNEKINSALPLLCQGDINIFIETYAVPSK